MTLYEIDSMISGFEPEVDEETGELLNADLLDRLNMAREEKIENVCLWIKNLAAESAAIKEEAKTLGERAAAADRKAESLKKYLDYALQGQKFKTPKCEVSYKKTSSVVIGDAFTEWAMLHAPELLRTSIKTEADKAGVKAFIKSGGKPDGAEIVERMSMTVK